MLPLTKEELKSNEQAKACYNCGKIILKKTLQKCKTLEIQRSFPLYQ